MSELKPCPFCGKKAIVAECEYDRTGNERTLIVCTGCDAQLNARRERIPKEKVNFRFNIHIDDDGIWTRPGAIEQWNRRAAAPLAVRRIKTKKLSSVSNIDDETFTITASVEKTECREALPHVDAVEVVRCGQCVFSNDKEPIMEGYIWCDLFDNPKTCGGFCDRGKRRKPQGKMDGRD